MANTVKLNRLDDFFLELNSRPKNGIYFYRITSYNDEINEFIQKYYDCARRSGVIIEGRIPNPDQKNLAYYTEMMGSAFRLDISFITQSLQKWLPRMKRNQLSAVAGAMYDTLDALHKEGKNENMLKNAYIKFMCWLYYKFERIVSKLGENNVPKILYEGDISSYELLLIRILAGSGCDIVLLEYGGDGNYLKLDPSSRYSIELQMPDTKDFPQDYSLKNLRRAMTEQMTTQRLYGRMPNITNCTNAWIKGNGLPDFEIPIPKRGDDPGVFYNCYYRVVGVNDKVNFINELYRFRLGIKNSGRNVVVVDNSIPQPTYEEISKINKKNYPNVEMMMMDLSSKITAKDTELQSQMTKTFVDIVRSLEKEPNTNINKITTKAVYLLCWLRRYSEQLFQNWKMPDIACFIYMGGCKNENEALFIRLLARLPVDVLILVPDKTQSCCLDDELLYQVTFEDSMVIDKYPQDTSGLRVGTVAYHAEQELDKIMYQDSGIYRNQQYGQAETIILKTMYEEVEQLWAQPLKYRPNFSTNGGEVTIPVLCAKICGVKNRDLAAYWGGIKRLFTPETMMINKFPCIAQGAPNPIRGYAHQFIENGKLKREAIKRHSCYQYGVLRDEAQEHILDKLQMLISGEFIQGTFQNGTEYTIMATVLNLDKNIIRLIQNFDFTKVNPKVICLSLNEQSMSLEDTILFTFLGLVGFDIAVFVPTGYQTIERFYNPGKCIFQEHQEGEYIYDLSVPNFSKINSKPAHTSWRDKLFRRGN